jgi:peroxiredoxin
MMLWRGRWLWPILGVLLALLPVGCGTAALSLDNSAPLVPSPEIGQSLSRPQPPRAGAEAFDFALMDLEGNAVTLSQFRGRRVLINFWAGWCPSCREEIPVMVRLYDDLRAQGLEILAVNVLETPDVVRRAARHYEMPFPVLLDEKGDVQRAYFVRGLPTSIVVDEEGVVRVIHRGILTEASLRQYARESR